MNEELPELKNFVYPDGSIHVARAVCRRAERAREGNTAVGAAHRRHGWMSAWH